MGKLRIYLLVSAAFALTLSGCGGQTATDRLTNPSAVQQALEKQANKAENDGTAAQSPDPSDGTQRTDGAPTTDGTQTADGTQTSDAAQTSGKAGSFTDEQLAAAGFSARPDMDLTKDTAEMIYAAMFQFGADPDHYTGKTVRISGKYHALFDDRTGKYYHYCLVEDAAACCVRGIEFVWEQADRVYPDDYPKENVPITVEGTFSTYKEEGIETLYSRLSDAKLLFETGESSVGTGG